MSYIIKEPVKIEVKIDETFQCSFRRIDDVVRRCIREYLFQPCTIDNIRKCESLISDMVQMCVTDVDSNCPVETSIDDGFTAVVISRAN